MIVLRDDSPGHLRFVGMGTTGFPTNMTANNMRDVARRVGGLLRERFGFLGTFTVDGIMSEDGFLPTELRARVGGALGLMSEGIPETGLLLHTQFLAHEIDTGIRARDFEEFVVAAADGHRVLQAAEFVMHPVEPRAIDRARRQHHTPFWPTPTRIQTGSCAAHCSAATHPPVSWSTSTGLACQSDRRAPPSSPPA